LVVKNALSAPIEVMYPQLAGHSAELI
jgi:hypothetical protein